MYIKYIFIYCPFLFYLIGPSVWETAGEPLHPGKKLPFNRGEGQTSREHSTIPKPTGRGGREGGVAVTVLSRCWETFKPSGAFVGGNMSPLLFCTGCEEANSHRQTAHSGIRGIVLTEYLYN